jgi:hypothetical protein
MRHILRVLTTNSLRGRAPLGVAAGNCLLRFQVSGVLSTLCLVRSVICLKGGLGTWRTVDRYYISYVLGLFTVRIPVE